MNSALRGSPCDSVLAQARAICNGSHVLMVKSEYLTAPIKTDKMPPGVPYIIGNEAAERFSYYGVNSILVPFMIHHMLTAGGAPDHLSPARAEAWYHTFVFAVYFLPV